MTHPFPTAYFDPLRIILHIKWHLFENVIISIEPYATYTHEYCYAERACMPTDKLRKKCMVAGHLHFLK